VLAFSLKEAQHCVWRTRKASAENDKRRMHESSQRRV
jgi:hypothetical protein